MAVVRGYQRGGIEPAPIADGTLKPEGQDKTAVRRQPLSIIYELEFGAVIQLLRRFPQGNSVLAKKLTGRRRESEGLTSGLGIQSGDRGLNDPALPIQFALRFQFQFESQDQMLYTWVR